MALGRMGRPTAIPAIPAGGGPAKEATMPPGMPTKADKGHAAFSTGDGIGVSDPGASQQGGAKNTKAFAAIPQLDKSI